MTFEEVAARVRAEPRDVAAAIELADQAIKEQCEEGAAPLLARAAEAVGDNPRLWQWLALVHRAMDDRAAAVPMFARAAGLAPADKSILHGRARIAFEVGLPSVALYEAALRLAPGDAEVLLGLAAARSADGDVAGAEALLASLLRRAPGWIAGHHDLALIRATMGDRARFIRSYEEALNAQPRDAALRRALIGALMQAERWDAALDAIALARAVVRDEFFLDMSEAAILSELGNIAAADLAFARITAVRDAGLSIRRIRHALRTGRLEEALDEIEPWIDTPAMMPIWPYAATAWALAGDPRREWLEGPDELIGVFDLADRLPPLDRLRTLVGGLHRAKAAQIDQSVRGGTQTDGILLARVEPELRALRAVIGEAIRAYVAALPPVDPRHPTLSPPRDRRPRLTGSWSVRLSAGGFHANHVHPAGWLSSALYLALPEPDRASVNGGWLTLGEPPAELGLGLAPARLVEPKPGRLVLFPSTMWHGTRTFAVGERMTIAFDVQRPL